MYTARYTERYTTVRYTKRYTTARYTARYIAARYATRCSPYGICTSRYTAWYIARDPTLYTRCTLQDTPQNTRHLAQHHTTVDIKKSILNQYTTFHTPGNKLLNYWRMVKTINER